MHAALAVGTSIVCDRYYYSGIVYAAAKQQKPLSREARADEVGLPRPDLVLFLDLDEDVAQARGGWGNEIFEKAEMQRRVRHLFLTLSRGGLGFPEEEEDIKVVDASRSIDEVNDMAWGLIEPMVIAVESGERGKAVRLVS